MQLARIFQPGMILQRQKRISIWGTAKPGDTIAVEIQGRKNVALTEANGQWKVMIPPLRASEEEIIKITSHDETIILDDVAVGEVWVAGGQSNMEFPMRYEKHYWPLKEKYQENLKNGKDIFYNKNLRFYDVPEIAFDGQDQIFDYSPVGIWKHASLMDIEHFSAVGYYFQNELNDSLDVPVGIIGCNWGGTSSVSWMSRESAQQTAMPWVQEYEEKMKNIQMDEYWEMQKRDQRNQRGRLLEDPFTELMLPGTPSNEEIQAFSNCQDILVDMTVPQPHQCPGVLFERMVKSIAPYTIRGFLWYQGESDDRPHKQEYYEHMLKALIKDWRTLWEDENLPFLIVQLPGFERWMMVPSDNWSLIRKCQGKVADENPEVYLCSISDAGERYDIHPKNKKIVGHRLALLALGHVYGQEIICDAPKLRNAKREGNRIVLNFNHAQGGLVVEGENINSLKVIQDGEVRFFTFQVVDNTIVLTVPNLLSCKAEVKFAKDEWYQVNLVNKANIPAIPFEVIV